MVAATADSKMVTPKTTKACSVRISRADFMKALKRLDGVAPKKSSLPILRCALMIVEDDKIVLHATDLDVWMRVELPVSEFGRTVGRIALPVRDTLKFIKNASSDTVTITSVSSSELLVQSASSTAKLGAMNADEFPKIPSSDVPMEYVNPAAIYTAMARTLYSVSTDETRYVLNGVRMEPDDKTADFVSTDGHRLSLIRNQPLGNGASFKRIFGGEKVIIQRTGARELRDLANDKSLGEMSVGLTWVGNDNDRAPHMIVAKRGGVTLLSRLIEGVFPDYHHVVPKTEDSKHAFRFSRIDVTAALNRLPDSRSKRAPSLALCFGRGQMTMQMLDEDRTITEIVGGMFESEDESFKIGLNPRYLLEALESFTSDTMILLMSDEVSPLVVKAPADDDVKCVIMPMRI